MPNKPQFSLMRWVINPEVNFLRAGISPTPSWILITGVWDDFGIWKDEEVWNDGV